MVEVLCPIVKVLTYPGALEGQTGVDYPNGVSILSDGDESTAVRVSSAWAADVMVVFDATPLAQSHRLLIDLTTIPISTADSLYSMRVWLYDFSPDYDKNLYGALKAFGDVRNGKWEVPWGENTTTSSVDDDEILLHPYDYWAAEDPDNPYPSYKTFVKGLQGVDGLGVLHIENNAGISEMDLTGVELWADVDATQAGGWSVGEG